MLSLTGNSAVSHLKNAEANLQTQNSQASLTCSLVLRALMIHFYTAHILYMLYCIHAVVDLKQRSITFKKMQKQIYNLRTHKLTSRCNFVLRALKH
jgi:hypothetical protein